MRLALVALAAFALAVPGCFGSVFGDGDGPGPKDYVSGGKYKRWVIELDVTQGVNIPATSLSTLDDRLTEVVDKPSGVEIRRDDTLPARGGTWSQEDVLDTDGATRDLETKGDTVVIHLMVVDGTYQEGNVLGATFSRRTDSGKVTSSGPIVIFGDRIHDAACPPPLGICTGETGIWTAVLVHEFGHAMGLVNNGAPMQREHEDEAHRGHSANQGSVMYWEVETVNVANVFRGGPPTTFDADDKADLCALGGKC